MAAEEKEKKKTRRKRKGLKGMHQNFESFVSFGDFSTVVLGLFVALYMLVLLVIRPMLMESGEQSSLAESLQAMPAPGERVVEATRGLRAKFHLMRKEKGISEQDLLEEAAREHEMNRKVRTKKKTA